MKKFLILLLIGSSLLGENLKLEDGFVAAHTEVLGDSTIDPLNSNLHADLRIVGDDITSIRGKLTVDMKLFFSDNKDRDKHMYETTQVDTFPLASYTIVSIQKEKDSNAYTITGTLDFHGVQKQLDFNAEITEEQSRIQINAVSKILLSAYDIDAPCLLGFALCVDDKVDLYAKAVLLK